MLLENVVVVRSSSSEAAVPLVGSYGYMYGILTSDPYKVSVAYKTFKDLMNGSKVKMREKNGTEWTKVKSRVTRSFADGDSIVGYTVDELCTISLPDFGSGLEVQEGAISESIAPLAAIPQPLGVFR